jgi:hypothetical protein
MQQKQRIIWKVIRFNIDGIGQIQQIREKLGYHIEEIKSIYVSIVPSSEVKDETHDVGELSLSFNNRKDHTVHITSNYNPDLPSQAFDPFELNQGIHISPRIDGYYRDYGSLQNEFGEFIIHEVKILLECSIKTES